MVKSFMIYLETYGSGDGIGGERERQGGYNPVGPERWVEPRYSWR